jgi:hypothetical protein
MSELITDKVEDWDARNLLYSLTFSIGNAIYVLGSIQKQSVGACTSGEYFYYSEDY